ncbi:MAG TPA: nitroreductase family protein [Salinivirgaceae bacterium]|mgnify:CR=1 FL=1|nr:nitroreductase family protein [Salinivirgaceae bacterium]
MNDFRELVTRTRSYRRFDNSVNIPREKLIEWVDLARLTPSAKNQQSLKYFIANTPNENRKVFECLSWAGYLPDWHGPSPKEQPTAYIVMLNDKTITPICQYDHGIAAQTIMLAANNEGFGGCIIAAVNRPQLVRYFPFAEHLEVLLVIALGKPSEEIIIEPVVNGQIRYYRDEANRHHVPKRSLEEVLINYSTETENAVVSLKVCNVS